MQFDEDRVFQIQVVVIFFVADVPRPSV